MKKIFAIVMLAVLMFNIGGYMLLFNYFIKQADDFANEQIAKGLYKPDELVEVKIPVSMPKIQQQSDFQAGYHHKIQDKVGNKAVLFTYCTMCRSGRVYSPIINGVKQQFRLVGARHYNAVIEDAGTKTWWYQADGKAAVGALKGSHLDEIPYEQVSLSSWLSKHPGTLILQPDAKFQKGYNELKDYDRKQAIDKDSTIADKSQLVRKSWVVGVVVNGQAKAYDWRQLFEKRLVNDNINQTPLLLTMEKDSSTYHAFGTSVNGKALHFGLSANGQLTDQETASTWDWEGVATAGILKGSRLTKIQSYQEYWHSWKYFHPETALWRQ